MSDDDPFVEEKTEKPKRRLRSEKREESIKIPVDSANEAIILAGLVNDEAFRKRHVRTLQVDLFVGPGHAGMLAALQELYRRGLEYDPATIRTLAGGGFDERVLDGYVKARPGRLTNAPHHLQQLRWDKSRAAAVPSVARLVAALQDQASPPEKLRALARATATAFEGAGDLRYLRDATALVAENHGELVARMEGRALYPTGIDALDRYCEGDTIERGGEVMDVSGKPRLIPGLAPRMVTVVSGRTGGGKALALTTPIATPTGWKLMGDLREGDVVFDERGRPTSVTHAHPILFGRECFEVEFSDGARLVADRDHLWRTLTAKDRKRMVEQGRVWEGKVLTTLEMSKTLNVHVVNRVNHSIATTEPLELPEADLPIDPYILGIWLGDGTTTASQVTSPDEQVFEEIRRRGVGCHRQKAAYRWWLEGMNPHLRALGVLGNKHIPDIYQRSSIRQRLDLIRGLMDSDGTFCSGKYNFDTTNTRLRDGFEELAIGLGIKTHPCERDAKLNGRVVGKSWRFVFCTDLQVFFIDRKKSRVVPTVRGTHTRRYVKAIRRVESVPVRCITVDSENSMYLAGRQMIPTHNSSVVGQIIARQVVDHALRGCRKVLWGAWENGPKISLEQLACFALGWSRSDVMTGDYDPDQLKVFEETMLEFEGRVRFFELPFGRARGEKGERLNDRHLDLIHQYIEDSGCEIVALDLFRRALKETRVDDEEQALYRIQAIFQETNTHGILVHQLRKAGWDEPTVEDLKGTGEWAGIADNVILVHLPNLYTTNDLIHITVGKQRHGRYPQLIESEWDGEFGSIKGGRTLPPRAPGMEGEADDFLNEVELPGGRRAPNKQKGRRR